MLKKYKLRSYNFVLVFILIVTSVFALMVVNSANHAYTIKQGAGMLLSFMIMIVVSFIDYNWLLKYYWIWYGIVLVMLIGVLTVFGGSSHGATRWFRLGPVQLQPSEFLKLALIILLAKLIAVNKERLNTFKFLALVAGLTLFPILLVALQPNLSTTILLCLIVVTVLFCAGLSYKIIGISLLIAVPVISAFLIYVVSVEDPILIKGYQRQRIVDFIEGNKSEDVNENDAGTYQQAYAVQAIGSGRLTGKGLNNKDTSSLKNAGYIAEAQNDFIFAVIGEELGFAGCCITILLLFLIVLECIIAAVRAKNFEGRLLCCGIAAYIGFQTFINIGVVSWILPNTGIPLPFFSCGITSLLTLFICMGMVLNVSLQRNVDRDDDIFAEDFRG
ncbi:MAG: FtsW/RodA/SpoVE family cell cycle protein [Clostridia bacterium]|nr:FtsW/RodA/SpoVE family cell cycle protein [Clostridia bacterium]